eukprot:1123065-Rhodomonas_salina.1
MALHRVWRRDVGPSFQSSGSILSCPGAFRLFMDLMYERSCSRVMGLRSVSPEFGGRECLAVTCLGIGE